MAKKKKTRAEKATKKHNFSYLQKASRPVKGEESSDNVQESTKSYLDPIYVSDLKKVLIYIGVSFIAVVALAYVVYQTNTFDFILSRFNIKY